MMKIGENLVMMMGLLFTATALSFGQVANLQPVFGEILDDGNEIKWFVESTEATKYFIVQRSGDGEHYKPLAMIQKVENTISYSFVDEKTKNKNWFYRVVNVDNQGVGEYTSAVYLEYAFVSTDTESTKPPTNITINDHIAKEMNIWLSELEFPTISKLGMVSNVTKLPEIQNTDKK